MNGRAPGKGKLAAELDRILASEAKPIPSAPRRLKTGTEIVREEWQRDSESKPEAIVRVVDHNAGGKTIWSGTPAEFTALQRALKKEG